MKENKGITLIALVITIIVLIILAGISIAVLTGEDGLVTKAKQGAQNYQNAAVEEQQALNTIYSQAGTQLITGSTNNGGTPVTTGGGLTEQEHGWLENLYERVNPVTTNIDIGLVGSNKTTGSARSWSVNYTTPDQTYGNLLVMCTITAGLGNSNVTTGEITLTADKEVTVSRLNSMSGSQLTSEGGSATTVAVYLIKNVPASTTFTANGACYWNYVATIQAFSLD